MIERVAVTMLHEQEELTTFVLEDVRRGIPELFQALEVLTEWLPFDWTVTATFRSKRNVTKLERRHGE